MTICTWSTSNEFENKRSRPPLHCLTSHRRCWDNFVCFESLWWHFTHFFFSHNFYESMNSLQTVWPLLKKQPVKCTSNGCTLLSQIECGAKAKRNGRETIRDFNTNCCCHILGKLLGGRLTICLTHCDNIPFPVQKFNVVDINSWLLYLSIWGIWVTKEKESIDGSITTYTQFSKQPTV